MRVLCADHQFDEIVQIDADAEYDTAKLSRFAPLVFVGTGKTDGSSGRKKQKMCQARDKMIEPTGSVKERKRAKASPPRRGGAQGDRAAHDKTPNRV